MAEKVGKLEVVIKGGKPWGFHIQVNEGSGSSVVVHKIMPGGKADQQNILQVGDHILRINGVPCLSIKDALQLIDSAFRTLTLCVWRPGPLAQDFSVYSNYENMNIEKSGIGFKAESLNIYENIEFRKEHCSVPFHNVSRSILSNSNDFVPENPKVKSLTRSKSSCRDISTNKYHQLPEQNINQKYVNVQKFPLANFVLGDLAVTNDLSFDKHANLNKTIESTSPSYKKSGFRKLDNFKSQIKKLLNKPEHSVTKEYRKCVYPNCPNQLGSCVIHSPPEKECTVAEAIYVNTSSMGKCNVSKIESKQSSQKQGMLSKYFTKGSTNKSMTKTLSLSSVYTPVSSKGSLSTNFETIDDQAITKKIHFFSALESNQSLSTCHAENFSPLSRKNNFEGYINCNSSSIRDSISSISSCSSSLSVPPKEISSKLSNFSYLGDKSNSISDNSHSESPIQLNEGNIDSGFESFKYNLEPQKDNSSSFAVQKKSTSVQSISREISPIIVNSPVFHDHKTSNNISPNTSYESDEFVLQTKNICNRLFAKSTYRPRVNKYSSQSDISHSNSSDEINLNSSFESTKFFTMSQVLKPEEKPNVVPILYGNSPDHFSAPVIGTVIRDSKDSSDRGSKYSSNSFSNSSSTSDEFISQSKTVCNKSFFNCEDSATKVESRKTQKETQEEETKVCENISTDSYEFFQPQPISRHVPQEIQNSTYKNEDTMTLDCQKIEDTSIKEESIYANLEEMKNELSISYKVQKNELEASFSICHSQECDTTLSEDTTLKEMKIKPAGNDSCSKAVSSVENNVQCVKDTDKELNRCSSQSPSANTYLSTSVPKAKLLTQYTTLLKNKNVDIKELSSEKDELIIRIDKKLNILKEEKMGLENELKQNEELGLTIKRNLEKVACPNEIEKYTRHVDELEKIIHLLKILSGRIARIESALLDLPVDAEKDEKALLFRKLAKLKQQYEEALGLQKNINNRNNSVSVFLSKYLTEDELADYDHFIHMKVELLEDYKELIEKIKLGEEQLLALKGQ